MGLKLLIELMLKNKKLGLLNNESNFGFLRLKLIVIEKKQDFKVFFRNQTLILITLDT